MANPHRPSLSVSTKVALGIVVVVAIAAFLYYSPENLSIPGIGQIGSDLTDIFSGGASGERLNFTMKSSVSALKDELTLEDASVTMSGTHTVDTSIGDSVFENSNDDIEVVFDGFNGRMDIEENILTIEGSAKSASSGDAIVRPKSKAFSVAAQLAPDSYSISPVTIGKITLVKVFGSIERIGDESSTTQLANSTVEIAGFEGSMSYDGRDYVLTGSATEVKGKSFTLKG